MDEYSSWDKETGREYVLRVYAQDEVVDYLPSELTEEESVIVRENITENIVNLANKYQYIHLAFLLFLHFHIHLCYIQLEFLILCF